MKSGLHDLALKESISDADKIFWKSEDKEQETKLIKIDSTKSHRIRDDDQFVDEFIKELKQGDVVVLMSNGNFLSLGKRILNKLN
jgi:UDP-N-acetylmuramate-alanine ligase